MKHASIIEEKIINMHNKKHSEKTKALYREQRAGSKHHNWKGGRRKDSDGYVLIHVIGHPNVHSGNYVFEHRLVMEKHLGRYLERWEWVHHLNAKKDDNRLENLAIVSSKNHKGEIRCPHCLAHFFIK